MHITLGSNFHNLFYQQAVTPKGTTELMRRLMGWPAEWHPYNHEIHFDSMKFFRNVERCDWFSDVGRICSFHMFRCSGKVRLKMSKIRLTHALLCLLVNVYSSFDSCRNKLLYCRQSPGKFTGAWCRFKCIIFVPVYCPLPPLLRAFLVFLNYNLFLYLINQMTFCFMDLRI